MAVWRPEPVLEEIWQNESWQDYMAWSDWAKNMRRRSGYRREEADMFGAWSDRYGDGKRAFLSSEAEFPEHVGDRMLDEAGGLGSWAWEEGKAWEVDKLWTSLGCEYLRTDPDGWVYASGWNDMLAKIHGAPHELGYERPKHPVGTVRRRRWVRWREPAGWTGKDGFEVTHTIKVDDSAIDTREWWPENGMVAKQNTTRRSMAQEKERRLEANRKRKPRRNIGNQNGQAGGATYARRQQGA
mmetsp:Transcript_61320/g.168286  ORF Transcript_61320/g.168286 Transcript_61320/m.168286 type:complete len:241 (+) Transcript_61320:3009-3731(+)